ncbi:toll/interleukin-1 receptor domain-containing protein [Streptomyces sp. NPDC048409]|uniref:toll/interleukin-1 receptor domain-containing protein n=1 Tax=Streptomyces sp. NPDC048409 TaxID=3154723 RepID=UPI003431D481
MKIFLSWSGDASKEAALLLSRWLRLFGDEIDPFVSSEKIRKGARGMDELKVQLDESSFGIACITRSNLNAPWVTFESGALSKEVNDRKGQVVPFLLEGSHKDLEDARSPLRQFQSARAHDREEVLGLVRTINEVLCTAAGRRPDEVVLNQRFAIAWPALCDGLAAIDLAADADGHAAPRRSQEDLLEDLASLVKEQISRITDLERAVDALRNGHGGQPRKLTRFIGVYDEPGGPVSAAAESPSGDQ